MPTGGTRNSSATTARGSAMSAATTPAEIRVKQPAMAGKPQQRDLKIRNYFIIILLIYRCKSSLACDVYSGIELLSLE